MSRYSHIKLNSTLKFFAWLPVGLHSGPVQSSAKEASPRGTAAGLAQWTGEGATAPPPPLRGRQRRTGLLKAMRGSGGRLLMEGLDEGRAGWAAGNDGLIPVGTRNICNSAIPSRTTFSTASLFLHSLGISSAVTNKINLGALLRIGTAYIYPYGWEKSTIATWLESLETARLVPAQPVGFITGSSLRKGGTLGEKVKWHNFAMNMTWLFCSFNFVSQVIQVSAFPWPGCPKSSRTNNKSFYKGLWFEADLLWELPSFWKELRPQYCPSLCGGINEVSPLSLIT